MLETQFFLIIPILPFCITHGSESEERHLECRDTMSKHVICSGFIDTISDIQNQGGILGGYSLEDSYGNGHIFWES